MFPWLVVGMGVLELIFILSCSGFSEVYDLVCEF